MTLLERVRTPYLPTLLLAPALAALLSFALTVPQAGQAGVSDDPVPICGVDDHLTACIDSGFHPDCCAVVLQSAREQCWTTLFSPGPFDLPNPSDYAECPHAEFDPGDYPQHGSPNTVRGIVSGFEPLEEPLASEDCDSLDGFVTGTCDLDYSDGVIANRSETCECTVFRDCELEAGFCECVYPYEVTAQCS